MNDSKNIFANLSAIVNNNPLIGWIIIVGVLASFVSTFYQFGKDIGEMLYRIIN